MILTDYKQDCGLTQKEFVRRKLETEGFVTRNEITYKDGIYRLGARIWDLRNEGMNICQMTGKKFKELYKTNVSDGDTVYFTIGGMEYVNQN